MNFAPLASAAAPLKFVAIVKKLVLNDEDLNKKTLISILEKEELDEFEEAF